MQPLEANFNLNNHSHVRLEACLLGMSTFCQNENW